MVVTRDLYGDNLKNYSYLDRTGVKFILSKHRVNKAKDGRMLTTLGRYEGTYVETTQ